MWIEFFRRAWRYRFETIGFIAIATVFTALYATKPWSKYGALNAASYFLVGLLVGQSVAWAIEAWRYPLTDASDFTGFLGSAPPDIPRFWRQEDAAAALAPAVAAVTARGARRCHVIGLGPGSGKSLLAAALAEAFARSGEPVTLMDTDPLRKTPADHRALLPGLQPSVRMVRPADQSAIDAALVAPRPSEGFTVFDHGPSSAEQITRLAGKGLLVIVVPPRRHGLRTVRALAGELADRGAEFQFVLNSGARNHPGEVSYYYDRPKKS
jgi:hypothetical protein